MSVTSTENKTELQPKPKAKVKVRLHVTMPDGTKQELYVNAEREIDAADVPTYQKFVERGVKEADFLFFNAKAMHNPLKFSWEKEEKEEG